MFGLKEAEVAQLVRSVSSPDLDRDGVEERFARATWSGITEPGDGIAGAAIEELGAPRALAAVVERWPAERLAAQSAGAFGAQDAAEALARWMPRLNSASALVALRQAIHYGTALRIPGDDDWPAGVNDLGHNSPLVLWVRGADAALPALDRSIALVGARAATGYGEHVTMEASAGLVDRGFTVVSGAAYGIDGMAHRAALASHGMTVAFLAGGVDRFYPSGHEQLLGRIVEHGAVVSELPCGSSPTKWRFLQRNRLIAAASLATVVVEAGWRSGALNTAHHAADLARPIGAVPGPVTSAASAGCHRLLREGVAICVTTPDEMAELVGPPAVGDLPDPVAENTRMLDALSTRSPRQPADIAARAGLSIAEVRAELGRLALDGKVKESDRGWTKRGTVGGRSVDA